AMELLLSMADASRSGERRAHPPDKRRIARTAAGIKMAIGADRGALASGSGMEPIFHFSRSDCKRSQERIPALT
ncbi:MAG: hypothetical protein ABFD80_11195, partial [Acidobacteriota bacterium]